MKKFLLPVYLLFANTIFAAIVPVQSNNFLFSPNAITINSGDVVAFSNIAGLHFVEWLTAPTSLPANSANLSATPINYTLITPGEYTYRCGIHTSSMFGTITVTAALPIKLKIFDAQKNQDGFVLKWITAMESNLSHFEIEKADNDMKFKMIGKILAKGNSIEDITYSFTDISPKSSDFVYYRLKMVDFDNKIEVSPIIVIKIMSHTSLKIYPNPASNILMIEAGGHDFHHGTNKIGVFNNSGNLVKSQIEFDAEDGMFDLDISSLNTGKYFVLIENKGGAKKTIPFVVHHD